MASLIASAMLGVATGSVGDSLQYTEPVYGVTVEKDVVYSVVEGYWDEGPDHGMPDAIELASTLRPPKQLDLKMDIYSPEGDGDAGRPLLLMMHGGAYLIGSKDEKGQTEWCRYFASLGYVAATIDYRLGFPLGRQGLLKAETDALDDARAALYEEAQVIVMENALLVPVHCYGSLYLTDANVEGFSFDSLGYPYLYEISLAE